MWSDGGWVAGGGSKAQRRRAPQPVSGGGGEREDVPRGADFHEQRREICGRRRTAELLLPRRKGSPLRQAGPAACSCAHLVVDVDGKMPCDQHEQQTPARPHVRLGGVVLGARPSRVLHAHDPRLEHLRQPWTKRQLWRSRRWGWMRAPPGGAIVRWRSAARATRRVRQRDPPPTTRSL